MHKYGYTASCHNLSICSVFTVYGSSSFTRSADVLWIGWYWTNHFKFDTNLTQPTLSVIWPMWYPCDLIFQMKLLGISPITCNPFTHVTYMWHPYGMYCMWHPCNIHVTSIWHACNIHVTLMWHACNMWHPYDMHATYMWHACDIHVTCMWHPCNMMCHPCNMDVSSMQYKCDPCNIHVTSMHHIHGFVYLNVTSMWGFYGSRSVIYTSWSACEYQSITNTFMRCPWICYETNTSSSTATINNLMHP